MKLSDLVEDPGTGQLSGTKVWQHIWNALCAWAFVYLVLDSKITDIVSVAIFMLLSGGAAAVSKFISMRFGFGAGPSQAPLQPSPLLPVPDKAMQ